jgi:hypothetical protein
MIVAAGTNIPASELQSNWFHRLSSIPRERYGGNGDFKFIGEFIVIRRKDN